MTEGTKVVFVGKQSLPQVDGNHNTQTVVENSDKIVMEYLFPITNTKARIYVGAYVGYARYEGAMEPYIEHGKVLGLENGKFKIHKYNDTYELSNSILYNGAYIEASQSFDRQLEGKDEEYFAYIAEHIKNVNNAYELYGKELSKHLDYDDEKLKFRVLFHDASKFSEYEFEGYRQNFYPEEGVLPIHSRFEKAWRHHFTFNDHHPEHYMCKNASIPFKVPDLALAEMFLDWCAMSMKFGSRPDAWFETIGCNELHFEKRTGQKVFDLIRDFDWSLWKEFCSCDKEGK